eukprot:1157595-Pelagomonas_calceolata.AAC.11
MRYERDFCRPLVIASPKYLHKLLLSREGAMGLLSSSGNCKPKVSVAALKRRSDGTSVVLW